MAERPSKEEYYLNIAKVVSSRGTCVRRVYGAIIVKEDRLISTGYCGAARGVLNCSTDIKKCERDRLGFPTGEGYDHCISVHAEENAIINAAKHGVEIGNGVMYIAGMDVKTGNEIYPKPCDKCKRRIINAGLEKVVMRSESGIITENVSDYVEQENKKIREKFNLK